MGTDIPAPEPMGRDIHCTAVAVVLPGRVQVLHDNEVIATSLLPKRGSFRGSNLGFHNTQCPWAGTVDG